MSVDIKVEKNLFLLRWCILSMKLNVQSYGILDLKFFIYIMLFPFLNMKEKIGGKPSLLKGFYDIFNGNSCKLLLEIKQLNLLQLSF